MRLSPAVFAVILSLGFAMPGFGFDLGSMTDQERAQFRAEIRDYLLDNPEVLVEAINTLDARQAEQQAVSDSTLIGENAPAIFADGRSWVGGNLDGTVTVVEFFDYRCGYCKKAHAEVTDLVQSDGNVRFILKEFPILGDQSVLASRFAIAVRTLAGPDMYWKMHDQLMTFRGDITPASLDRLATDLGLDPAAIRAGMESPEVEAEITANHALGDRLHINGTPSFVLQDSRLQSPDTMLRGYVPQQQIQQIVTDLRG